MHCGSKGTRRAAPSGRGARRTGDLEPLDGMVKRHNHLKIGWYHQHLAELLDLALTPLEYMFREFPEARGPGADRVGLW